MRARRFLSIVVLLAATLARYPAPARAAFPGGNGKIAFARFPRTSAPFEEIYTIKPGGSGLTRLTFSGGGSVSNVFPDWNANGNRIAFQHSKGSGKSTIRIMKPNGKVVDHFGDPDTEGGATMPAWAPDGHAIAYVGPDGVNGQDVWTYDVSSGGYIQISTDPAGSENWTPEWSPLGDQIVYSRTNGSSGELVVVDLNVAGNPTGSTVVAGTASEAAFYADWSPTGDQLVYMCTPVLPTPGDSDICIYDFNSDTSTTIVSGPKFDQFPAFSPDGNRIVWNSGPEDAETELKVKNLTTGAVHTITSNHVTDEEADWGIT